VNEPLAVQPQRAMERIRDYLGNRGYRPHGLTRFSHASAFAAADVFEDAGLAIDAFKLDFSQKDIGCQYLRIYGVLQAAYLQQDALRNLHEACGLGSLTLPDEMKRLREARNSAAGHPAPRSNGQIATLLVRCSLSGRNITLHRYLREGGVTSETIDFPGILENHNIEASRILDSIAAHLDLKDREARIAIIKKGYVVELLSDTWSYLLGKCHEASFSTNVNSVAASLAMAVIPSLQNMISNVESGLRERDLPAIDAWHIGQARAGLERLETLLEELSCGLDRSLDVAAFSTLVEQHFKYISEVLVEIDKDLRANA